MKGKGKREINKWKMENRKWKISLHTSRLTLHFSLFALCFLLCLNNPVLAKKTKVATPENQYKYQQKILRREAKENYKRSLLPQSGYMTVEEYEGLSTDIPNADKVIPPPKPPKDIKIKYVPQPTYKLTHYNNPPGSPELHILRRFKFDRQMNCTGITSPNKDIMVYPVVYYYAMSQCTAGDLFVIPLDTSLPYVERVSRANIIKRIPVPILSTDKDITEKFTFRTITPIDFSADGTKLVAKEKIGNVNDGIWKTNLWIYDFVAKQSKKIPEIREAIKFYWMNTENLVLDEKRWDIYPLGFDTDNPDRVVVSAYGYTGRKPKFLGNWSIDAQGQRAMLLSLFEPNSKISMNGFKLTQDGVVEPKVVKAEEKKENKAVKKKRKAEKKAIKQDHKKKKQALKKTLKEMKQEEHSALKQYQKQQNKSGPTGIE
ncbi:MAG: hypothetical protein PHC64_09000 [Candidatus Gastranaerophilales bacterium]|nr:hypothetical protein [Candidatus Gastranaerophilales bacterium]